MDVDPGTYLFCFIEVFAQSFISDVQNFPKQMIVRPVTVRLPYALTPGMDLNSTAFQKAVAYIAKQQPVSSSSNFKKSKHSHLPASHDQGTSCSSLYCLSSSQLLSALPRDVLGEFDQGCVNRARDLIADAVMSELMIEDSQSQTAFQASLRHQVVSACQQLRVQLIIIDKLMSMYNNSRSSSDDKQSGN